MSIISPGPRDPMLLEGGRYASSPSASIAGDNLINVLRRHRILIAAFTVAIVALVGGYTLYATPTYEAQSMLRFEPDQVNLPQLVQQLSTENRISTEIEVLQGRNAVVSVIDSLGLRAELRKPHGMRLTKLFSVLRVAPDADTVSLVLQTSNGRTTIFASTSPRHSLTAGFGDTVNVKGVTLALASAAAHIPEIRLRVVSSGDAVRSFQSALKVSRPARDADLIDIQVQSSDPVQAAAAANILARQLISGRHELQMERTGSAVQFLKFQIDTLGTQLKVVEDSLSSYRTRTGVVDAPEQARTQVARLAQIQADRGAVEAERDALALLVKQIGTDSGHAMLHGNSASASLMSFPTLFKNQATAQLFAALANAENERAALLVRRKPEDPDVLVYTERIHEINEQLRGIAVTYLQGLTNQSASLDTLAAHFGTSLDSLPKEAVQTARLERSVSVLQDLYTLMQTRLKEAEVTQSMADPTLHVVDSAVVSNRAVQPKPALDLAIALVLGVALGVGASLARDISERRVRSRADALSMTGLPVVGALPRAYARRLARLGNRTTGRQLVSIGNNPRLSDAETVARKPRPLKSAGASRIAELLVTEPGVSIAYVESLNQLHMNLVLAARDRPLKTIVFTSPLPGEGKTLTAINFALTVAARGLRVLLIDADLRRGMVNDVFAVARTPGFSELLQGTARFENVARHIAFSGSGSIVVIPTGSWLATPARVQTTAHIQDVLNGLTSQFDLVVIDSPPVNLLADAAVLGSATDGVLLVARAGQTPTDALRYAMEQLTAASAPVIGTLLNDIDLRRHVGDDASYHYLIDAERYYAHEDRA